MERKFTSLMLTGMVAMVLVTSACSKKDLNVEKIKKLVKKHKIMSAAVATGVAAGAHYAFDAFGLKKHKCKECVNEDAPVVVETVEEPSEE